eukprot:scaffold10550_cov271-Chaetoceros_neogracile.AAC.60
MKMLQMSSSEGSEYCGYPRHMLVLDLRGDFALICFSPPTVLDVSSHHITSHHIIPLLEVRKLLLIITPIRSFSMWTKVYGQFYVKLQASHNLHLLHVHASRDWVMGLPYPKRTKNNRKEGMKKEGKDEERSDT